MLNIKISLNENKILHNIEIIRISNLHTGTLRDDVESIYKVLNNGQYVGELTHVYGDGSLSLTLKAVELVKEVFPEASNTNARAKLFELKELSGLYWNEIANLIFGKSIDTVNSWIEGSRIPEDCYKVLCNSVETVTKIYENSSYETRRKILKSPELLQEFKNNL